MKKISFKYIALFGSAIIILANSCKKDNPAPAPPIVVPDQSFVQSFDNMGAAIAQGWTFQNLSDNAHGGWAITDTTPNGKFTPFDGTGLLYSDYSVSSDVTGNISNWAISPRLLVQNGDKISFYTVSQGSVDGYGDRLQLRINLFNTSDSIGELSTDIGHFTTPLVDVNPLYKIAPPGDYPNTWTKYEATISGLNHPDSARFALRYFVELNGGANGDEIAVDKVEFKSISGH